MSRFIRKLKRRVDAKVTKLEQIFQRPKALSGTPLILLTYFSMFILACMVIGLLGITILFAVYSRDLPNPNKLIERHTELATKFFDRNGELIYEVYGEKNRELTEINKINPYVIYATLATEDAEFYFHKGYSLKGMVRALRNMLRGESTQSGSTITQQVVKNAILTPEQKLSRKVKEIILSLQIENKYTKEQILQMYLNETPYGGQNYGILTAARSYFNKAPADLTIAESAYLAGLPQSPSYYSHFGLTPEAGIERKNYVLYLMNTKGWIGPDGSRHFLSDEDYAKAKEEILTFQQVSVPFKAPHFVFYLKDLLINMFGEDVVEQGGLQVTTSLDLKVQDMAQTIVAEELEKIKSYHVGNGAVVVLEPKTGQILAMVGSKGYFLPSEPEGCISGITGDNSCLFEPNLNVATSRRQPGSAIKPITFATMLAQGYTAAFPFLDVPTKFPGSAPDKPYEPENYDGKFRGPISLRKSLGNSLNISAVKALGIVGINSMIDMAEKMGISTFTDRKRFGLALTLGGGETKLLELTGAFSVFANKGKFIKPTPIIEIKDAQGKILYKPQSGGNQVITEETAFLIADILSDDGARADVFGANSLLNIPGHQVAVKTGTTDDKRDNYAIGFTPNVVTGVWVGNNNNDKMNPYIASGITGATPIWRRFMVEYLKDKKAEKFETPKAMKKIEVDSLTGMLPMEDFPKRQEWFIAGSEPTAKSSWYQKLEICKVDGRIANDGCREADKTKIKTFIKVTAELPEWQDDVDKWVKEKYSGDSTYYPPTIESHLEFDDSGDVTNKDEVYVDVIGLKEGDVVPLDFRLSLEISSGREIKGVRIYKNGEKVTDDSNEPFGYNFTFTPEEAGEYEFTATAENEKGNKGSTSIKLLVMPMTVEVKTTPRPTSAN